MTGHEKLFQNAFVSGLQQNGWTYSGSEGSSDYDRGSAIIPSDLKYWVTNTQPKQWSLLVRKTGNESHALKALIKDIVETRKKPSFDLKGEPVGGAYNLLLRGVKSRNIRFKLFQNRPSVPSRSPEDLKMYDSMVFRVVSELYYSQSKPYDSIDLGFFINGIPVGTAELKSPMSGQGLREAERQYRTDRIPGPDLLLNPSAGALFHFAVSTDRASLTTALCGGDTRFIPFNTGIDNTDYARKNPDKFATSYLWKEVLSKSNLSVILSGMMRNVEDNGIAQTRFPRYHQLDNLKKITSSVQSVGGRKNYLSQHAPGSGKSDEIANLAYALSMLHDSSGELLYSSVIVITNRTVLDDQIGTLLKSKIKLDGYFHPITKSSNGVSKSSILSEKLLSVSPPRIMSVTAQTFTGTLLERMRTNSSSGRKLSGNYAIIIDEAHDGETGKQHQNMYKALLGESFSTEDILLDDESNESLEPNPEGLVDKVKTFATSTVERAVLPVLNFFAYTATPNADALRVFGEKAIDSSGETVYEPFHTYSMHQAREEGYINDVLANYVTHERFVQIDIDDVSYEGDRIVDFTAGRKAIGRWMQTLPEIKKIIVEIIMQKMQEIVMPALNGEGKAMLSCSSRSEAVAYKHLIDEAMESLPKSDRFETLVAFSGTIHDPVIGDDVNEIDPRLNKSLGRQQDLAVAFKDKKFRLMIVANKYQVGFDQPKLMCMFLDKPLKDINLIQTTARVNRKIPGKENVYIFDFVNDKEQVIESFRKFDEDATLALSVDLSSETLDDLLDKSSVLGIHTNDDIEAFTTAYDRFNSQSSTLLQKNEAAMRMSNIIDVCSGRFRTEVTQREGGKAKTDLIEYKASLRKFNSMYSLLSITRSGQQAIGAIYRKYGKYAHFFDSLSKALTVSGGDEATPSVDVNALRLKKYEIIAQGSIGGLGTGTFESETANYSGDVSGIEVNAHLGPVEVLINEINDYPELTGNSSENVKDLVESLIVSLESDVDLVKISKSTSEKSFTESQTVQRKIIQNLSRQSRQKSLGVGMAAKAVVNKQGNDSSVLISIAQVLHRVIRSKSDSVKDETLSAISFLVPEPQTDEALSLESRLPAWVRVVED